MSEPSAQGQHPGSQAVLGGKEGHGQGWEKLAGPPPPRPSRLVPQLTSQQPGITACWPGSAEQRVDRGHREEGKEGNGSRDHPGRPCGSRSHLPPLGADRQGPARHMSQSIKKFL